MYYAYLYSKAISFSRLLIGVHVFKQNSCMNNVQKSNTQMNLNIVLLCYVLSLDIYCWNIEFKKAMLRWKIYKL